MSERTDCSHPHETNNPPVPVPCPCGPSCWCRTDGPCVGSRPRIVAVCGSTRFIEQMAVVAWEEEKRGKIALSCHLLPQWYTRAEHHLAEEQGVAGALDRLHLRKVEMADEVIVVDVGGYVGDSTRREIALAERLGKPIRYWSKEWLAARSAGCECGMDPAVYGHWSGCPLATTR